MSAKRNAADGFHSPADGDAAPPENFVEYQEGSKRIMGEEKKVGPASGTGPKEISKRFTLISVEGGRLIRRQNVHAVETPNA